VSSVCCRLPVGFLLGLIFAPEDRGYYFFIIILSGMRLSPLATAANIGLLYQSRKINDGDCGAIGGVKIGRRT
jgi:hypothetical protein